MKPNVKSSIVPKMFKNQIGNIGISSLKSYNHSLVNDYDIYPNIEKTWGYGLLLYNQKLVTGRSSNSGSWVGLLNTYFWVDHRNDLAGVFLTQVLPCYTPSLLKAFQAFEELTYKYFTKR